MNLNIKQEIKLVIWDMDETFLKGTISESKITTIDENIDIIKKLTARGIINSICSKNEKNDVKNQLIQAGILLLCVQ